MLALSHGPELIEASTTQVHVVVRLVQPGSWQPCAHCHETIEYVPGANRSQATSKTYVDGSIRQVSHFHDVCYRDWGSLYGEPF